LLLVLPPGVADRERSSVVERAERLGWTAEVSAGVEQTVVALDGAGSAEALEAAFAGEEVDVVPLPTARAYRLARSRRTVLTGLAAGLALFTALGAAFPVLGFLSPPRGALGAPDVVAAVAADGLEPGQARVVSDHERSVLLVRLAPDRFVALGAACTHEPDCRLVWDAARRLLTCPCHGDAFDIHGNVVRGPASLPLRSYPVERVGEELFVRRG